MAPFAEDDTDGCQFAIGRRDALPNVHADSVRLFLDGPLGSFRGCRPLRFANIKVVASPSTAMP